MSRSGFSRRAGGRRFQPFNKLLRRGRVPTYGSFSAGYITTTGLGTAIFVGRAAAAVVLSVVAAGTFAAVGNAQPSGTLPADLIVAGSSNAAFAGATVRGGAMYSPSAQAGELLATGYGDFEAVGSTNVAGDSVFSAMGTGAVSFVGRSAAAVPLSSTGTGLAQFGGLALSTGQGVLSSAGTGLMNVVGAARSSQPVSMLGIAIGTFVGVTGLKAAASMTGAATASLVGAAAGAGSGTITLIQGAGNLTDNNATGTRIFASNVTSGNKIVVCCFRFATADDPFIAGDCTRNAGASTATIDAISLLAEENLQAAGGEWGNVGIWAADVTGTGSLRMDVAGNANDYWGVAGLEINSSSGWNGSYVEATVINTSGGINTNVSSGNVTSAGKAIFIGVCSIGESAVVTITPDAAFTQVLEEEDDAAHACGSIMYKIVTAGNTDSFDWTLTNNGGWRVAGAVIKGA